MLYTFILLVYITITVMLSVAGSVICLCHLFNCFQICSRELGDRLENFHINERRYYVDGQTEKLGEY